MRVNDKEIDISTFEIKYVEGVKFYSRMYYPKEFLFNEVSLRCSKCGQIKDYSEYGKSKKLFFGVRTMCNECRRKDNKVYSKGYREKNRDHRNAYAKEYNVRNNKAIQKRKTRYREQNRELLTKKALEHDKLIAKYDVYAHQLTIDEAPKDKRGDLAVKCTYCGKYFKPTNSAVKSRLVSLKKHNQGESRLYCSDGCKAECPTFGSRGVNPNNSVLAREANPVMRQEVLKRDNYECQKCGNKNNLHCHHIIPVKVDPGKAEDTDNCITFCRTCHYETHGLIDGCGLGDLRMLENKCDKELLNVK